MKLLLATGNAHKLAEFRRMFPANEILSPKDLGVLLDVEETGKTFAENAAIKARFLFEKTGVPTIADDSGLCVDALGGFPGVYTARYAESAEGKDGCARVLTELKGVPAQRRGARFVCAIHLIKSADEEYAVSGEVEGKIGFAKAGEHGFGYDPIFYVGKTSMAQMPDEEKDAISHRGKAFEKLLRLFEELGMEI